jgi:hypothetical protein
MTSIQQHSQSTLQQKSTCICSLLWVHRNITGTKSWTEILWFWHPKVSRHVHKTLPLKTILNQFNPIHISIHVIFMRLILILFSRLRLCHQNRRPNFPSGLWPAFCMRISFSQYIQSVLTLVHQLLLSLLSNWAYTAPFSNGLIGLPRLWAESAISL